MGRVPIHFEDVRNRCTVWYGIYIRANPTPCSWGLLLPLQLVLLAEK